MADILAQVSLDRWIFQTIAMCLTAFFIPGLRITCISGPVLAVVSLAFVNSHLWSTALFFNIPDTLTSQTALLVLTNGLIFWILVKLLPGIEVRGFLPAIAAPFVFTVLTILLENFGQEVDWPAVFSWLYAQAIGLKEYFLTNNPSIEDPSPINSLINRKS